MVKVVEPAAAQQAPQPHRGRHHLHQPVGPGGEEPERPLLPVPAGVAEQAAVSEGADGPEEPARRQGGEIGRQRLDLRPLAGLDVTHHLGIQKELSADEARRAVTPGQQFAVAAGLAVGQHP